MLASILNSKRAIRVNIQIVRIFIRIRKMLETQKEILKKLELLERRDIKQDDKIMLIYEYLKQFEASKQQELERKNRPRIGFKP